MLTVFPIITYSERKLFCSAPAVCNANYQYLGKVVAGIIDRELQENDCFSQPIPICYLLYIKSNVIPDNTIVM